MDFIKGAISGNKEQKVQKEEGKKEEGQDYLDKGMLKQLV